MFEIEHKDYTRKWKKTMMRKRYATEAEAWEAVASFDQDGFIDRALYRVVPVK